MQRSEGTERAETTDPSQRNPSETTEVPTDPSVIIREQRGDNAGSDDEIRQPATPLQERAMVPPGDVQALQKAYVAVSNELKKLKSI